MAVNKKKGLIIAAILFAAVLLAVVWTVWPRSWDNMVGNHTPTSLTVTLIDFGLPNPNTDIWKLSAEQAEGAAVDAIMDALRGSSYRGRLGNIISYSLFKNASHSYSLDRKNSDGYVNILLVDGPEWSAHLTVYSGGLAEFGRSDGTEGLLFYETSGGLYDTLSGILKEYGALQDEN